MSESNIDQDVHARRSSAVEVSRALHAKPELAFEEHDSARVLQKWLSDEGFEVTAAIAGLDTAFIAEWGQGSPRIAFMAEYDALPEIGHACGHNLIASGGLLAGAAVRAALEREDRSGTVVVIGTPGEEGQGGKIFEIEAGVFDDVDAAIMFHPADRTILTRRMLAAIHLDIEFHGVASHASKNPADGRSALAAMVQFFVGVDALRQHVPDGARLHGIITNGGQAPNIVPELTEAAFIVRDKTLAGAEHLQERVRVIAEGAAMMTGTTVEIRVSSPPYAHLNPNQTMAGRIAAHLDRRGVEHEPASPDDTTGSTDAGNVSLVVPTVHPFMQIADRGTPSHSRPFAAAAITEQAENAMVEMAMGMANLGWELLTDSALLAEAQAEFEASVAGIATTKEEAS